jgi:F-box and leucine-rich repeat protein GRR1
MPVPPPNWQRNFDHLRTLDLTSCSLITDEAVEAIVSNAPKIRSLILAKCTGLSDASLASICGLGRSLHQLHMGHVSKYACFLLSRFLPVSHLEKIPLAFLLLSRITDGAVAQLARTCTRLRYIDLACAPSRLAFVLTWCHSC